MVTVTRIVVCTLAIAISAALAPAAQDAPPAARFDVASVRVNRTGAGFDTGPRLQPGGRVFATNVSLVEIIKDAYNIRDNQLLGAPEWARTVMFDIDARAGGEPTTDVAAAMVRTLLAERFALRVHRETRELPVYLLTRVPDRQKVPGLKQSGKECAPLTMPQGIPMPPPPPPGVSGLPLNGTRTPLRCPTIFAFGPIGHVSGRAITMDSFASALTGAARRPVINQTGLEGEYDIDLTYGHDLAAAAAATPDDAAPALFTALRESLGLRLDSSRAPIDVLVIDRLEKPTEN